MRDLEGYHRRSKVLLKFFLISLFHQDIIMHFMFSQYVFKNLISINLKVKYILGIELPQISVLI